ncbi:MAG: cell division protein FtsZ [Halobacteriovoraceae bacterium]|nr:cell division protein FtsZ [Halobacteriovoraceae bacterium]
MFEISNEEKRIDLGAKIRVIGIGGGGCNAVNTMIRAGLTGVEYIVANTDAQALNANLAPTKIQLGAEITKGLGAGANPEIGRKSALDEYEKLSEVLEGSDMVFITAGMGGGTGTGAAPVVAKLAKEMGALTVGVVTRPFQFEGKKRRRVADDGIITLEENVDSLITIPNQRLLQIAGESLSLIDTFKTADEVLLNAVRGISDLINNTGHINADFADVCTVMAGKGLSLMGTGVCSGQDRAIKAATEAISSPLLEDITIDGATGIIINITGSSSLTMHEANEATTLIMEAADEDAEIIFGTVIDENMQDEVKVTVVATGLGGKERVSVANMRSMRPQEVIRTKAEEKNINPQRSVPVQSSPMVDLELDNASFSDDFNKVPSTSQEMLEEIKASKSSNLMNSIQNAAERYGSVAREEVQSSIPSRRPMREEHTRSSEPAVQNSSRAKSIAEKLGFINFDEDEFDTPSFMRKEDEGQNSLEH